MIRFAGFNERRSIARESLGFFGTIVTIAKYRGPQNPIELDTIYAALRSCIVQHPALSTIIAGLDTTSPYLAKATQLDLREHTVLLPRTSDTEKDVEEEMKSILERAHNERLHDGSPRPQWRVYVSVHPSTSCFLLAFSCSHVLSDGISATAFHSSFLQALQTSDAAESTSPIVEPSPKEDLKPAMDQMAVFPLSWSLRISALASQYLPSGLWSLFAMLSSSTPKVWTGSQTRPALPGPQGLIRTSIHLVRIPSEVLSKVLKVCRTHNARLTGLLNFLVARAVSAALHSRNQEFSSFATDTAINLRPVLAKGDSYMGNYVSSVAETFVVDAGSEGMTEQDWALARRSTKALSSASGTLSDQPSALLGYVRDFVGSAKAAASQPPGSSFGISNVGVFDGKRKEDGLVYQVEDIIFSLSSGLGTAFDIYAVSSKGGCLNMSFTWWPGMLGVSDEEEFVNDIGNRVGRDLKAIAGSLG